MTLVGGVLIQYSLIVTEEIWNVFHRYLCQNVSQYQQSVPMGKRYRRETVLRDILTTGCISDGASVVGDKRRPRRVWL